MRWVFVGLVVINATYFFWSMLADTEGPRVDSAVSAGGQFPKPLELLSASGAGFASSEARAAPPLAGCPAIGPFADPDKAGAIVEYLGEAGHKARSTLIDAEPVTYFWVYLPPFEGRQQSLRKLRELHAAGIDSFIVSEGADSHAISLGSFTVRDSALGLQARLRAAGHPAQVREQVKSAAREWVVLSSPQAQGFLELIPPALLSGTRLERRDCPAG